VGQTGVMARTWLSIRVDLVHGRGQSLWPRPGRVFAARRTHTFLQLGEAIDTAFARWDRSHLTLFRLPDEHELYGPIAWEDPPENATFAGAPRSAPPFSQPPACRATTAHRLLRRLPLRAETVSRRIVERETIIGSRSACTGTVMFSSAREEHSRGALVVAHGESLCDVDAEV